MYLERLKNLKAYKTETTPCKVKLSSNESPFDLSEKLKERIKEEIVKINFQRYPDPHAKELKEALAKFVSEEENLEVSPENLVLGNGSDEIIHLLITVIGDLKNPVMYPVPSFPMYQVSSDVVGRPKAEFLLDDNFQLTEEGIQEALKQNPDIAFFASPNNPTGNSFDSKLIMKVIEKGIFTVIDEAYIHFSDKENFLKVALEYDNVVVLRTMSKVGLASIRLGYMIAKKDVAREIDKGRLPFNITYPTQVIGKIVLTEGKEELKSQIKAVKEERKRVMEEISKIPSVTVYPSDANFFLMKTPDGNKTHQELIKRGVLTRNMSHLPKMENCIRVSIGRKEENDEFIKAMREIFT
ncbi:MAG: histidinol-phosphate transaminase [Sulfurihydrogenibium sp.]|uniref:Histidinol-phosphate aminotransferase n=1 Tax=Sulfurihydrogenibium azorense TaxID=309806 RepID=A0A832DDE0_9AQUI|nr:MAG: histidinol-phosphate transaminase [Sulfurihydrogenibium sp.]PMP77642.1 MAG: histidinol-phosphate transaminase [Sulfurihydrogenibium sp.]HEV08852.1 histidinol-phosphate transaminase [Sulfurihydrogenibium azorense]